MRSFVLQSHRQSQRGCSVLRQSQLVPGALNDTIDGLFGGVFFTGIGSGQRRVRGHGVEHDETVGDEDKWDDVQGGELRRGHRIKGYFKQIPRLQENFRDFSRQKHQKSVKRNLEILHISFYTGCERFCVDKRIITPNKQKQWYQMETETKLCIESFLRHSALFCCSARTTPDWRKVQHLLMILKEHFTARKMSVFCNCTANVFMLGWKRAQMHVLLCGISKYSVCCTF